MLITVIKCELNVPWGAQLIENLIKITIIVTLINKSW